MLFMLAALLGIVAANAQITQGRIGTGDITISGTDWPDVYGLDFDNDGTLEFRIQDFDGGSWDPTITNGYLSYNWTDGGNNIAAATDYAELIGAGVTINSSTEFGGAGDATIESTSLAAGTYYMGFRISLSDGVHYGWAECTVAENGDDYDITWTKCYYNATVGEAITTGDEGGSTPTPTLGAFTVANGTETNSNIPFYGNYADDNYQRSQTIYPASMLTDIVGKDIYAITYYPSSAAIAFSGTFELRLGISEASSFSGNAYDETPSFTTVYTGTFDCSSTEVTLTFDSPFTYTGGNLMVDFRQTVRSSNYRNFNFYGTTVSGASVYGKNSNSVAAITPTTSNFMPKTTFMVPESCTAPSALEVTPTETTAAISWTENGSATAWQYKLGDGSWTTVTSNPYTITGLTLNTAYTVQVRSKCGDEDFSFAISETFRTNCGTEAFPYFEGFESYTAGTTSFPYCWTKVEGTSYVQENGSYTTYASQGTKTLVISADATVVSPVINVAGSDVYVNFDLKRSSTSAGTLAVGIAASPELVAAAVYFDTIEPANTNYDNYEYIFHNTLSLTSGCLVFKQLNSTSNYAYFYLDSLTVSEPPACPKPTGLTLDEATDRSLTLSWTETGSATKWVVKVNDGEWTEVRDNPYELTGLTANTEYAISVRAFCDPDTSDAVNGTFRTLCGTEAFPYSEDFESYAAGTTSFPPCWTSISGNNCIVSSYASQGTKALQFGGTTTNVVTSPMIAVGGNPIYINFDLKREGTSSGTMAIGISESTSDISSAVFIDTINPGASDNNYNNYEYFFQNEGRLDNLCLVFKQMATSTVYYYFLDSLTVSEPPACPKPTGLTLDVATDRSLTLSWTEAGSATTWVMKVGDGEWTEVRDNPYELTGLTANTEYAISVRAFCDPDTSDAVSGTFRTLCAAEAFPYSEDFESYTAGTSSFPPCWTSVSGTNYVEANSSWTTYASQGTNALHMQGPGTVATPVINIDGNDVFISFDLKCENVSNSGDMAIGVAASPASVESAVWIDTIDAATTYNRYEYTYHNTLHLTSGCIIFKQVNTTYSNYYYWIDSLTVTEPPACAKPTALTLDEATENSLTVTWTENGSATKWLVKKDGDAEYQLVEDNPTYTFEGLTASTDYTVEVRAFCDPDTSDALTGTFRTTCATQTVPYTENFDAMTTYEAPECWTVAQTYTSYGSSYPYVSTYAANGGSGNGLYFYASSSNSNIIATPMLDRNANSCLVTFDAKLANYSVVRLITGVMTNPSDASTFVGVDTIVGNVNAATWKLYEIDLSTYDEIASSEAKYVAFKFDGSSDYGYLDNLSISGSLPCKKPTDLSATATENSFELSWTENGSATQWLVKVDDGDYQLTSDNPYTVTGLTPSSTYTVEVRAYCGEGDTSYAVIGTFNTECAIEAVPYTEDFEGISSGLPNCWEQVASNETRSKWDFTASGHEGNAVFFEDYWAENSRLIVPAVDCSTLASDGVIRFSYKRTTNSYDLYVTANAYYRTSSDGEWTAIEGWTLSETMDEWDDVELTLPSSANAPYYQVSILATGANTYSPKPSLYIDDLYIGDGSTTPGTCDVPTGLAANNVTENSAVISWTGSAAQYEVELNGQASTVTTNSYNATGLTAATDYAVRVRALCDGGLTSDWTAMVNFTTLDEQQPTECNTPTGLAVSNITENSASISWNEVTIAETFDGEWNLAMGAEDSVHTMITPDATMHTLLNALNMDFEDVDENVSVAGTLVPVTIEPAAGNQMNITGSFDMAMYGVEDPVTFHFNTTGTVTSTGMTIAPATINETVRIMNAMDIDYTGTLTFVQPTALPENGTLTIGIASMNITGYGDTTVYMMTGSVSISMVGTNLTASGTRETANAYPTYELVVTNVATGVETPIANATTPYALQGLTSSTDYTVKVRTHCDENSTSEWSAAVPFTTLDGQQPVECDVPTNVATSNITATSVTVSWTGTASEYQIEVSDGGATPIMQTVSASPYTVEGLTASTDYTVRVRALCENDETSDWSAAVNFTTLNGEQPQGIDDVNGSYSVSIYPNPASEKVTVSVDGLSGKAQVSVIDMSGRTVMTTMMEGDSAQLNVSKLAQGTYFVRINGENISTVRKLVVR